MNFSHFDAKGQAVMVDVTSKLPSQRTAIAEAKVHVQLATIELIQKGQAAKGDVLNIARLAGIAASKKTSDLIPLAHPISLHAVSLNFDIDERHAIIKISGKVTAIERTGVEMEAMVAVSVAALTIYDMCKGIDRGITISDISLVYKDGGKSGVYRREEKRND
jgi:cyclic pyranopterin phosphate synthase